MGNCRSRPTAIASESTSATHNPRNVGPSELRETFSIAFNPDYVDEQSLGPTTRANLARYLNGSSEIWVGESSGGQDHGVHRVA